VVDLQPWTKRRDAAALRRGKGMVEDATAGRELLDLGAMNPEASA
jgi:hypothetical protein